MYIHIYVDFLLPELLDLVRVERRRLALRLLGLRELLVSDYMVYSVLLLLLVLALACYVCLCSVFIAYVLLFLWASAGRLSCFEEKEKERRKGKATAYVCYSLCFGLCIFVCLCFMCLLFIRCCFLSAFASSAVSCSSSVSCWAFREFRDVVFEDVGFEKNSLSILDN